MKTQNQKPVIERLGEGFIVRDDYLPGGTKQRGLIPYLQSHPGTEFVYASPAYGYAQVALSVSARLTGKQATIFTAKRNRPHPLTRKAYDLGARVMQVKHGYLNVVQKRARDYCAETGAYYLPFGANLPEISAAFTEAALQLDIQPEEVWTVSGSGTLTRSLQAAWPQARFITVLIGKQGIKTGSARKYNAPEAFEQPAKHPPPFNSCLNYDAKAWRFYQQYAQPGALFWNVAA